MPRQALLLPPYKQCTTTQRTLLLARLNPKFLAQIAREARIARNFSTNWAIPSNGAHVTKIEAVLHACGYRLAIVPLIATTTPTQKEPTS